MPKGVHFYDKAYSIVPSHSLPIDYRNIIGNLHIGGIESDDLNNEKGPFDNFLILANVIARPASALNCCNPST